jgi:DNA-binding NarL/FixJ family response regulator
VGRDEESAEAWSRAHLAYLGRGDRPGAARCAFWIGMTLIQRRGDMARGAGWLGRAQSVLEDWPQDCVERGFLLMPMAIQAMEGGDPEAGLAAFEQGAAIAEQFGDADLMVLTQLGRGQALIFLGEPARGVAFMDEVMVAVTTGEVSPIVMGIAYCAVIDACRQIFDLRRAHEWTDVLSRWCEGHPDLVPFRGQCLVHRAEIMQLHGAWTAAVSEAHRARELLAGEPAMGAAFYREAELHRLRGEFDAAEVAYGEATTWGASPQPGLALLRLAQGKVDLAESSIRLALDEASDAGSRATVLPAFAEILLAAGDVTGARQGADELSRIAGELGPFLQATSRFVRAAVLLAEDDPPAALAELRAAWAGWAELDVPYEAARVRALAAVACSRLGDTDTATMEIQAARKIFEQLGAVPDLAKTEDLLRPPAPAGGLTGREVQILALVAEGKTNRAIATELFISEKTVARHVSNIFTKLGLSSRSAATAYAYQHGLV